MLFLYNTEHPEVWGASAACNFRSRSLLTVRTADGLFQCSPFFYGRVEACQDQGDLKHAVDAMP